MPVQNANWPVQRAFIKGSNESERVNAGELLTFNFKGV